MEDFVKSWIIRIKKYLLEVFFKKVDFVLNTFNTEKIYKKLAKNQKMYYYIVSNRSK